MSLAASRGGEFLLEALGFIVLDEAIDEGASFPSITSVS